MKKSLFIIALACLMTFAACKKDKENQGEAQFTATTEHQGGRTSLDPNNGQINWSAGDQIVIANDNDETAVFTLQSGEGTTEGGFGTSGEFNTVGPFIAAYPSDAVIGNDKVTFNLPATQSIENTETFAIGANPMVACSDDKNLSFKNLCGGLGIRLKGVGAHVTTVRITSKNTSEKLWGAFEVSNCAANEPTLTEASGNQGSNVITLTCDVTLTTAAKTFFVMLPPGTLANGFTMEVLDGNEVLVTKETTSNVAFVERNSVKCFNEILIDVEFDGNVEIPAGMSGSNIIVTNFSEEAIPDENGDFAIGYSKMLMATNATNGEIIYMSIHSVDDDIRNNQGQFQDYELSAKETAITLALNMLPHGLLQSKDETFASIKSVLYSLGCVQSLKTAIESVVAQYGYLKMDELSLQIIAVRDFFMNELFPESKGNGDGDGEIPVVGIIELAKDGSAKLESPSLPVSRYRGIRVDLESANYNESNNTWSLNLTAYSDNGIYVGVNKGYFAANGQAYVSEEEKTHYFIPPMNAGRFVGTFVSWSGIKDYFNDTKRLFTEEGFSFDDMTWDKAKLENIRIDIGVSDDALTLLSPRDDTRTAIVNAVYTVLGGINCWVTTDGIMDYFMELFMDDDFVLLFINNWNNGVEGFTVVAERICEKFEDFLFEQSLSVPANSAQIPEKLKGKVETIQKAVTKLISMINFGAFSVGTAASFNLFEGFALEIDAEFNEPNGGGDNHEYVDLGLPSGLLWAICNVGANAPEEYGDYFAWGETQPKDVYNWSTYQYCMGSDYTLTKYCYNSSYGYNGFTDNLTTLLSEDDAVTANWGSGWRMPTKEEWEELMNNTTVTWTQQNGVNGRLFTASNGNSLFLPAAGYRNGSSLNDAGSGGHYWSSSLRKVYSGRPHYAWFFSFGLYGYGVDYDDRNDGQSVRAVRSIR